MGQDQQKLSCTDNHLGYFRLPPNAWVMINRCCLVWITTWGLCACQLTNGSGSTDVIFVWITTWGISACHLTHGSGSTDVVFVRITTWGIFVGSTDVVFVRITTWGISTCHLTHGSRSIDVVFVRITTWVSSHTTGLTGHDSKRWGGLLKWGFCSYVSSICDEEHIPT